MWGSPYAVTMPMMAYPPTLNAVDEQRVLDEAERQATDTARQVSLDGRPLGAIGDPATAITKAAHSHRVDVIVVGSHDRSWFSRLLRPAVAAEVLLETDIPVLIVE